MHTPILRGVDAAREHDVSLVPERMIEGQFSLEYDEIVIGSGVARRMGLQVGDFLSVVAPQGLVASDEIQLPEELRVAGFSMWACLNLMKAMSTPRFQRPVRCLK